MANVQNLDIFAGTNQTVTIAARDQSNNVATLTGKSTTVYVAARPNDPNVATAALVKTGTTVSAVSGTFSIAITTGDTSFMTPGNYIYQAQTTDSSGNIAVVSQGRFRIRPIFTS